MHFNPRFIHSDLNQIVNQAATLYVYKLQLFHQHLFTFIHGVYMLNSRGCAEWFQPARNSEIWDSHSCLTRFPINRIPDPIIKNRFIILFRNHMKQYFLQFLELNAKYIICIKFKHERYTWICRPIWEPFKFEIDPDHPKNIYCTGHPNYNLNRPTSNYSSFIPHVDSIRYSRSTNTLSIRPMQASYCKPFVTHNFSNISFRPG